MNLGFDNLRELLENFLGNTGGRRGREREQRSDGAANPDDPGEFDPEDLLGDETDAGTAAQAQAQAQRERPDPDEMDDDEVVDDLYHRIENLEDDLERKDSQLGTIQDSTEHVSEQVEDVNDTIRQLLGIYDRLTDDVNPFTGNGEEKGGFGVFDDDEPDGFGLHESPDATADDPTRGTATASGSDETVSFEDLKHMFEDAATASAADRQREAEADGGNGQKITFDEREYLEDDDDTRVEVQATESVDEPDEPDESADRDEDEEADDSDTDSEVTLENLANTYASDVLVFEWLTQLVRTAGPAATLRAISYYCEIGWIDEDVKSHLESVLSGPDLDIHVDPMETPEELTAEDHADSYTYIVKLQEIHETRREVTT